MEALEKITKVIVTDIVTLNDALQMIEAIGGLTQTQVKAAEIIAGIKNGFTQLKAFTSSHNFALLNVCYLIWRNPYMTVGSNTFIHEMLTNCGCKNVFGSVQRYPAITAQELIEAKPNVVLLSSEPYPFKEKHIAELQQLLPEALIILTDGEMFSWYGSRLLHAPAYFMNLLKSIHQ